VNPRLQATVGLVAWLLSGCVSTPGTTSAHQVQEVVPIGPLLAARIERPSTGVLATDPSLRLIFPNDDTCARILVLEAGVDWAPSGLTGEVRRDGSACPAIGIASLREWRDRRPRPRLGIGGDRGQATYRIVLDTSNFAIVRGRFPLANLLGWVGGQDTVALIPKTPECRKALERTAATIEYRATGPVALALLADGRCPIQGFVRPGDWLPDDG
jgi:hypothetical protein